MASFEQSRIDKIKEFEKTNPADLNALREHIRTLRAGTRYNSEQYLFMFNTFVQHPKLKDARAVLRDNGICCAINTLGKVLMAASRYIDNFKARKAV